MLKLRDWIDVNNLDWRALSCNSNAIKLLKENQDKLIGIGYHLIQMLLNY